MNAKGFDMSRFQDNSSTPFRPDLKKARAAGMDFVIIRALYLEMQDRDFEYNFKAARDAGFPVVGTYAFPDFRKYPEPQVNRYFDILHKVGETGDLVCGDFEPIPGEKLGTYVSFPSPYKYRLWMSNYMIALSKLHHRPVIYSNPNIVRNVAQISQNHPLTLYPYWIANYYVPTPFALPWTKWTFWQYALGKSLGLQFGMESKDIDLDQFNGTTQQLKAWIK